jgi:hypothetical protein
MPLLAGTEHPTSSAPPTGSPLRASDADRAATVRVLQDAVARGLLTPDEGSERMAAAFAAVHRRDLGDLTADLPPGPSDRTAPGWRALASMAVAQLRSSLTAPASGRQRAVRVAVAVLLAVLLLVVLGAGIGELLFDGGGGPGPGGFGRR